MKSIYILQQCVGGENDQLKFKKLIWNKTIFKWQPYDESSTAAFQEYLKFYPLKEVGELNLQIICSIRKERTKT